MGNMQAWPQNGGIQVLEEIDAETIDARMVYPDDPDWLDAMAIAGMSDTQEDLPPEGVPLEDARARAIGAVNLIRGEIRKRFVTDIPGQQMVYLQKEREAGEWIAARMSANQPDPSDFPHIVAEVGITGADMDQVAQVYLNMAGMFRQVSALIEAVSLAHIAAVEAVETAEAAAMIAEAHPQALMAAFYDAGVPM